MRYMNSRLTDVLLTRLSESQCDIILSIHVVVDVVKQPSHRLNSCIDAENHLR